MDEFFRGRATQRVPDSTDIDEMIVARRADSIDVGLSVKRALENDTEVFNGGRTCNVSFT